MPADEHYNFPAEMQKISHTLHSIAHDPVKLQRALDEFPDQLANVVDAVEKLENALN